MGTGMTLDHIVDKYESHRHGAAVSRRQTIDPENGRTNLVMSWEHFLTGEICTVALLAESCTQIVRCSASAAAVVSKIGVSIPATGH